MRIKPGQTIRMGHQWGTVSYLIGNVYAIVTLDDLSQAKIRIADVRIVAQDIARWPGEGPVQEGGPAC